MYLTVMFSRILDSCWRHQYLGSSDGHYYRPCIVAGSCCRPRPRLLTGPESGPVNFGTRSCCSAPL